MEPVQILHIITDETRFRLLCLLSERHYCVKALAKKMGVSEPAISQQMRVLKQYQLVEGVKIGYQVHYRVNREKIMEVLNEVSQELALLPQAADLARDSDCTCEFAAECLKRGAK